jgi:hypothetical protein
MKNRLLLDVVVPKGSAVFKLFAVKDEALLVWGGALLVLKLGLNLLNRVRGLDIKGDGPA